MTIGFGAYAEQIPDLFRYTALVTSQNSRDAQRAASDGLAEVIVRASGDNRVLQEGEIIRALGSANNYIVSQTYEATTETIEVDNRQVPAQKLVIEFSGELIQSLLRRLQLPLWPNNRRSLLVWMVVDDAQGRRVVSDITFPEAQLAMRNSTKQRGLPLIPKLMDLEDQTALSANQLWTFSIDAIRRASERYYPDTILVVRLSQSSRGDWRSDWQLLTDEGAQIFDIQQPTVDDVIANGINQVVNYFCTRECIQTTGDADPTIILLELGKVGSFRQYSQALEYLQGLTLVRQVDVGVVLNDNILLYLRIDGDVRLLRDTLSRGGRMISQNNDPNNFAVLGSAENPLLYAWRN